MMGRMDLKQMRPGLREGWRGWFPWTRHPRADGRIVVVTAKLVGSRRCTGAAVHHRVSLVVVIIIVIIVRYFTVVIVVVVRRVGCVGVGETSSSRCCRRATTTTSTATDTTTANAVDLHHFAVDRSRRLGSTRRGHDAATDHHHQTITSTPTTPGTSSSSSSSSSASTSAATLFLPCAPLTVRFSYRSALIRRILGCTLGRSLSISLRKAGERRNSTPANEILQRASRRGPSVRRPVKVCPRTKKGKRKGKTKKVSRGRRVCWSVLVHTHPHRVTGAAAAAAAVAEELGRLVALAQERASAIDATVRRGFPRPINQTE